MTRPEPPSGDPKSAKEQRLSEALRRNLRRRKRPKPNEKADRP